MEGERIPNTAMDFFQAMKNEFLFILKEMQKSHEQYFLEILDALGRYSPEEPEIALPDYKPGMELPTPTDDEVYSLDAPKAPVVIEKKPGERLTREELAHQGHHDGKGYRMSCEFCKQEKYNA